MTNVAIRVILPAGFRLADGRTLREPVHLVVISRLEPYYASVDMVRLLSGGWLEPLPDDIPVATAIWMKSIEADTLTYQKPEEPAAGVSGLVRDRWERFLFGRSQYVAHAAAFDLVTRMLDIAAGRGSKRIGNLEISQPRGIDSPGQQMLDLLRREAEEWKIVVQSGGRIGKGGRVRYSHAVRALEQTAEPGRMWLVTGMGANRTGEVYFGGRIQTRKFYSPFYFSWYRVGPSSGFFLPPGGMQVPLLLAVR